ncbi:xyloglucan endotransglucosylase/hydrolase protein 2-like [Cynara cardunculus var. scolymus]|uniref:xyloglucan endotransglucosylase/hydrolase protein 2-like n=1 Tax=Cynara cardunculus var. scolymus TaxID=59895 RepID=UPI000D62752A|nr:xyloglucan endotransglucosylase/hydrolase protein 2-like [Cynara cardunculus var. scolymus]
MVIALISFKIFFLFNNALRNTGFNENYTVTLGNQHVLFLNQGREVQLSLDRSSGAGFQSKEYFGSGYFQMRIKLPDKDSAGVVTAFYLYSNANVHDELDFEFLGNRLGKPIALQTNIFLNGVGGREQKTDLWFDPVSDFHYYKLLWNRHQIVFFVDDIPIRVFKNNIKKGVGYPTQTMQVMVSLWDGSDWATDGGRSKANYSNVPFQAHFRDFNIDGCPSIPTNPNKECHSTKYWWNGKKYNHLNPNQLKAYENVRKKYMTYDYCADRRRYPTPPPECIR